jgi:hypothetical protein
LFGVAALENQVRHQLIGDTLPHKKQDVLSFGVAFLQLC